MVKCLGCDQERPYSEGLVVIGVVALAELPGCSAVFARVAPDSRAAVAGSEAVVEASCFKLVLGEAVDQLVDVVQVGATIGGLTDVLDRGDAGGQGQDGCQRQKLHLE